MVLVQLGRILTMQVRGCGFESRTPYFFSCRGLISSGLTIQKQIKMVLVQFGRTLTAK